MKTRTYEIRGVRRVVVRATVKASSLYEAKQKADQLGLWRVSTGSGFPTEQVEDISPRGQDRGKSAG